MTGKYISYSLTIEVKLEVCTRYRVKMEEKMITWIQVGVRLGQQYQEMLPKIDETVSVLMECLVCLT